MNFESVGTLAIASIGKQPADLIVQIGARAGLLLGGGGGMIVPHTARLVQIDLDAAEIGRLRAPDLAIIADAAEALTALADRARENSWRDRSDWIATLRHSRSGANASFHNTSGQTDAGLIHPYHAARAVAEALSPDTAIALDGGESVAWFQMFGRPPGSGLYTANGYLGTLGIG